MSIERPSRPAVSDYPNTNAHATELEEAKALFEKELSSPEDEWEDQGEREGVKLWKKVDPDNPYAVPTVKGETLVENVTSDAFLGGVIQLPGMRKLWDGRFVDGFQIARYSRTSYCFYSEMKGMGWLVYPRDIVGIQKNHGGETENGERTIIQTTVEETGLAPEQKGKTRATLKVSGWHFAPEGEHLKVTYIVNIALNGSIPYAMVSMLATETPLCCARSRDVYYEHGYAPFIRLNPPTEELSIIFQTESFSDPPATVDEPHPREYRCVLTTGQKTGETFEIEYDTKRMYREGIMVEIEGEGIEVDDDGNGRVKVTTKESGKDVVVVICPK
ncbi:START domain-containing protein [Sporobolomyces salmoneus]|uniref:START domain-containing protein n=1 Tax=Sporobolomyces salmoneus TaxID=183962 RepID=UPI0031735D48